MFFEHCFIIQATFQCYTKGSQLDVYPQQLLVWVDRAEYLVMMDNHVLCALNSDWHCMLIKPMCSQGIWHLDLFSN